jgi:parallel beta-helix repeat protein
LEGFLARSSSGWGGDAGILVISKNNIIRNNAAGGSGNVGIAFLESQNNTVTGNTVEGNHNEGISLKNSSYNLLEGNTANENRYGIKLESSETNVIRGNTVVGNRFDGLYLEASAKNTLEGNYIEDNWGGISLDNSRDNIIRRNDILANEKGIHLAYHNRSDNLKSEGKGVYISYNSQSSDSRGYTNNTIYRNNLSNKENAYDDGLNRWDNGKEGNNHSDFDEPDEGCEGRKTCDSEHRISGGSSIDRFPLVSVPTIRASERSYGPGGSRLRLTKQSFRPGDELWMTLPHRQAEAWVGLAKETRTRARPKTTSIWARILQVASRSLHHSKRRYQMRMYDGNGTVLSAPFNVTVPRVTSSPLRSEPARRSTSPSQERRGWTRIG